jgi:hypothetical protein
MEQMQSYLPESMRERGKMAIVNFTKNTAQRRLLGSHVRRSQSRSATVASLGLTVFFFGTPDRAVAQPPQAPATKATSGLPDAPQPQETSAATAQQSAPQTPGSIQGTVMDATGAAVAGAHVQLTRQNQPAIPEVLSGDDGQFSFTAIAPGPFQITITSPAFAPQSSSGVLHPGEVFLVPPIVLAVATEITQVQVVVPRVELAEEEIKEQEKQRVFGVIPNFYVTYIPDAVPLTSSQKFGLAWKTTIDPVNFGVVAVIAGVQQAQNNFKDYGPGAQGYAKRYGASYADFVSGTFIGGAILPSLLKQDPRYFYKGTGTTRSRILYALANSVICKGDNHRWQPNYSAIGGSLASGGISNLYYPSNDRGAALVFENTLIGIGENAATNLLQEFVIRKLTPNAPNNQSSPTSQP